ncbi:hypothetical protein [Hymenobacter metallilatus]|uniref:Uncharacterized protein n=1 Tax=Hymenobacter metallilatus TaxID=2493666 RepID=A0A3R9N2M7_9BACT|nr:hypothetical protein [Hymenobacter metallilatus]RSK37520.1 hypothetical protein EI290_02405 [Hymenobacter metallilatus]
MNNALHGFVEQLHALAQRPTVAAEVKNINGQALFAALLNNELKAQAGEEGHRQADHVVGQYFKAVLLCRKNELAAALAQLQQADGLLDSLPAVTVDFVTLFQLSAWGNYRYKTQEGDVGIALLRRGLGISARLERQGFGPLIYRRIEQVQNIANILFRQQQVEAANQLLSNALTFVHTGRAQGLLLDDWDWATMRRVRTLQESTLEAVLSQLAAQNTQYMADAVYHNEYYHRVFFRGLLQELETDTYNRVVLYNWLYAKNSYFERGAEEFLRNALEFLADEAITAAYDVFKANLLAQAIWVSKQQATHRPELIGSIQDFAETTLVDRAGKAIRLVA